jgi:hypothetical protein
MGVMATAMLAATLTGGVASATIGGTPLTTAAPDLRSATVTSVPADRVRFCFDQPVAGFGAPGGFALFHLNGYNDDVVATGTSIGVDAKIGRASCRERV